MPKVAIAESLLDWKRLIETAGPVFEGVPDVEELLAQLRAMLERAKKLDELCLQLKAQRQVATKELRGTKEEGKQLAIRIRSHLKGVYGFTSPALVGFGMKPRPLARGEALPKVVPAGRPKKKNPAQE